MAYVPKLPSDHLMMTLVRHVPQLARLVERYDPVEIEVRQRLDVARLEESERASYNVLRATPMSHNDAMVWIDHARSFRGAR